MSPKPGNWRDLASRDERIIARIARQACGNTIMGGCSAKVLAERLVRMGGTDLRYVVGAVYSVSSGRSHYDYDAWSCPECGSTHLGYEAAVRCCQQVEDSVEEEEDELLSEAELAAASDDD